MTRLASARQQWAEGTRRFDEAAHDSARTERLYRQRATVLEELNRRVGPIFTLAELAHVYDGAERWLQQVVEERAAAAGWARSVAWVGDAAFDAYSRGARDYAP